MCHLVLFLPFPEALSIYILVLGVSFLFYFKVIKAMRMAPRLGKEAMLGKIVTVIKDIVPEGKIEYSSEIWSAFSEGRSFYAGDKVVIQGFWGMQHLLLVNEIPVNADYSTKGKCGLMRN